jgi:hypothetical protein
MNLGRPDPKAGENAVMVPFDYGWYDEETDSWWHANMGGPGMKVYQSDLEYFSQPLGSRDTPIFDRQVFTVALARKPKKR